MSDNLASRRATTAAKAISPGPMRDRQAGPRTPACTLPSRGCIMLLLCRRLDHGYAVRSPTAQCEPSGADSAQRQPGPRKRRECRRQSDQLELAGLNQAEQEMLSASVHPRTSLRPGSCRNKIHQCETSYCRRKGRLDCQYENQIRLPQRQSPKCFGDRPANWFLFLCRSFRARRSIQSCLKHCTRRRPNRLFHDNRK